MNRIVITEGEKSLYKFNSFCKMGNMLCYTSLLVKFIIRNTVVDTKDEYELHFILYILNTKTF